MQKRLNSTGVTTILRLHLIPAIFMMFLVGDAFAQTGKSTVTYFSSDSLMITADDYFTADTLPYILLLHDQGSSRGEFSEIATRFQKMNYNCLAVDLRNGGNSNFIGNETTRRCRELNFNRDLKSVEGDITASVNFAYEKSAKKVILIGAGANGALALKTARENDSVKAVVALSPGEFFQSSFNLKDTISGIAKPVLITSTKLEFPYLREMMDNVDDKYKRVFTPEEHPGARGTEALMPENLSSGDYWLAILLFFKDLQ